MPFLVRKLCGLSSDPAHDHGKRVTQLLADGSLLCMDGVSFVEKAVHVVEGAPSLVEPGDAAFDEGVTLDTSAEWVAVSMTDQECGEWAEVTGGLL